LRRSSRSASLPSRGSEMSTPIDHQQLGKDLFNLVWKLLESPERSREDDDRMIHAAHASAWHWRQVGKPVNFARSEWQISRVYSVLRRSEPAWWHAQRSLDLCEANGIGDFDLAFAHEALARAAHVGGDAATRDRHLEAARKAAENIAEADDKEYLLKELSGII
jgi:hypothetical protein